MFLYKKLSEKLFATKDTMTALDFKSFLASRFRVKVKKSNEWWTLAKELEQQGLVNFKRTKKGFVLSKPDDRQILKPSE